jgi:hypothetical protein
MKWRVVFDLLVAEPVLGAAIGTLPGDAVAGHAPDILIHAGLADAEAAAAAPAEGLRPAAAMTGIFTPQTAAGRTGGGSNRHTRKSYIC